MRTVVKLFQPRFAPMVEAGTKRQTVRMRPKRERDMPEVGDKFSGREWIGKPYVSKQRVLCDGTVTEVEPILIEEDYITVNTNSEPCESFAIADGFTDFHDMIEWFKSTHSLPFEGILIKWKPL
jgi:hypothetical protein